jgi:hypothetical protein
MSDLFPDPDPDRRLQKIDTIVTFLVQKSIVDTLKYTYFNFSVHI